MGFHGLTREELDGVADELTWLHLGQVGALFETLQDAGIGLRSRRLFPFYDLTLRFDMPIWVNNPAINLEEEETKFRYLFSIQGSFSLIRIQTCPSHCTISN